MQREVEREGVEEVETAGFLRLFLEAMARELDGEARARLGDGWLDIEQDEEEHQFFADLLGAGSLADLFTHFAEGRDME